MTKLEMAHDWAMKRLNDPDYVVPMDQFAADAWRYADAMQAESEKRSDMERPAVLQDEWQPDWSVAPEWAVAWTKDSGETLWWSHIPWFKDGFWFIDNLVTWKCCEAPSFGYQGSWENSLRKRP